MKGLIPKIWIRNLKISHRENGLQRKPLEAIDDFKVNFRKVV